MASALAPPPDVIRPALIGPNALLQLADVLEAEGGEALRDAIFHAGGVEQMPGADGMIPEGPVADVHQAMRAGWPDVAQKYAWDAGERTARYIMAHRIPKPAQLALRVLPARMAAQILARAIEKHSWTFAGSGTFRIAGRKPLVFEIVDNPVVRGEVSEDTLCRWHEAVFETLFTTLASRRYRAREVACCAQSAKACRFVLTLLPR